MSLNTHTSDEIEFGYDNFEHVVGVSRGRGRLDTGLGQRLHQGRRVQVVETIERQQCRHVREQLVPDTETSCAIRGHHAIYYVVRHTVVLPGI